MLTEGTYYYKVDAPAIAKKIVGGQFVILRLHEEGERIPLSICGMEPEKGYIELIVQSVGKTSYEINEKFNVGDDILDVVGPLGVPTPVHEVECVVLIGGGFGVGALLPIGEAYKKNGAMVATVIGARNKDLVLMEDRMSELADKTIVTTDDGSHGMKGLVTDGLKEIMKEQKVGAVIAIGPVPMMRAVANLTKEEGEIPTYVSLNSIMVDGTGMCGACRVSVDGTTKFACVHGPDFNGHQVDYDELISRLGYYKEQEKKAWDLFKKECDCKCDCNH